ncbi:MAG: toprim domain-containing protein, partial [Odoribacter sp.]|nr:toprim domain-containing protein [Odoribacter sp.]
TLAAHGFNAICFGSESTGIPKEIIYKLSFRFKHLILLYDTDKTGKESTGKHAKELERYGVKPLFLPLPGTKDQKDITDYFRLGNSRKEFITLFIDLLDSIYTHTLSILKSCELNMKTPPPQAETIITVNTVPLATQGNLLCITGGEGTGKSNYIAAIMAGTIRDNDLPIDTLGLTIEKNQSGKTLLFYDTEQSEVQLYKNMGNLLRRANMTDKPDYFRVYCLTGMSRKERLQCIIESMDRYYFQYDGIQMVVIDGVADLIKCVNDETESIAIIEEFYRLAGIYNTCIICVLHFVPNGLKLRGHLGSELQRKAAAILSIEKDEEPEISAVKALKVRDGSPLDVPIMQFSWNKRANMHTFVGEKPVEAKEKRKEAELIKVAQEIFNRCPQLLYNELTERIQLAMDVKERTAKSYIKFMREKEIIKKDAYNTGYFSCNLN